jgi:hypothetical protein
VNVQPTAVTPRLWRNVLGIYVWSRVVGFELLLVVWFRLSEGGSLAFGQPLHRWHDVLYRWDASFYRAVGYLGYPATAPTPASEAADRTWAFYPIYPFATRIVSSLTGLDFENAGVIVNLLAGAIAVMCFAALVDRILGRSAAIRAAMLWAFFPTAIILQLPYSEAVYLAFAAGCLLALVHRKLGLATPLLVGAGLSRAAVLPLSAAAIGVVVLEWRSYVRADRANPVQVGLRHPSLLALVLAAVVMPVAWMTIAALVTGDIHAFARTQALWLYSTEPRAWVVGWSAVLRSVGTSTLQTINVAIFAMVVVVTIAFVKLTVPLELKLYAAASAIFFFIMGQPGSVAFSSVPRFAMSMMTVPIVLSVWLRRGWLAECVVGVFILLQFLWIVNIWSGRIGIPP